MPYLFSLIIEKDNYFENLMKKKQNSRIIINRKLFKSVKQKGPGGSHPSNASYFEVLFYL